MMTPKDLLDTMLGYLGFVVQIEETMNEGGNPTLQIYTEESRRLIGRNGETLEAIQFLLNRLLQARDKDAEKVIVDCEHYRSMREDRIVQRVRELADRVRTSGRQRNFCRIGFGFFSTASAMISPSTGANLNPWPQSPAAIINPRRSGSRAIQKFPSCVSQ